MIDVQVEMSGHDDGVTRELVVQGCLLHRGCRFDSFDGGCTGFIIGGQDSFDSLARLNAGGFCFLAAGGKHWSYR